MPKLQLCYYMYYNDLALQAQLDPLACGIGNPISEQRFSH